MDPATIGLLVLFAVLVLTACIAARAARIRLAREELEVLRSRALTPPQDLQHMATLGLSPAIEAKVREAFALVHRDMEGAPTLDHLRACFLLHQDAVRHYDRLGNQLVTATRARKLAERQRDALVAWITQGIRNAELAEDLADAPPVLEPRREPIIAIADVDRKGRLRLGAPH